MELLSRAAANLAAEYPLLRVAIHADADGTNPAFVPCHGLFRSTRCAEMTRNGSVRRRPRTRGRRSTGAAVHWCASSTLSLDAPQEVHDLVLTVSHIIADATTALSLLHRLVEHAARVAVTCRDDLVESRPVIGAPEDLLPARYRGPRGIASATGLGRSACRSAGPAWQAHTGGERCLHRGVGRGSSGARSPRHMSIPLRDGVGRRVSPCTARSPPRWRWR